ncbi:MAG: hypothetical protein ABSB35_24080 [Bryobacteraceae bacterium]|jgi:hypothetical protein
MSASRLSSRLVFAGECGQPLNDGHFGYVAGLLGHATEARTVIEDLKGRRERSYAPAVPIAGTYLALGEIDACLDWLETALSEREPYLGSVLVFPGYDRIQGQPRFVELVRQVGLADSCRSGMVASRPGFY